MNIRAMKILITKLALIATLGIAFFPDPLAAKNHDFNALIKNLEKTKQLANLPSGTSIVAVKNNEIIAQINIGYADIENNIKVTGDTPYYIASVTKPFTALNVLLDIENKKLPPNLRLSDMFPEFEFEGINKKAVGIHHLMTHTSAIDNYPLVLATAYSGEHNSNSLLALVDKYSKKEPHDLGVFQYTNVGYNLYSIFSDQHFEHSWQKRLHKQIFEPLKFIRTSATRTFFDLQSVHVAKPYSLVVRPQKNSIPLEKQDTTMHAAGGMFASSNDLAKFLLAQLNRGKVNGKQVFPESVILKSQQQQVSTDREFMDFKRSGYAWGWYTGEYKGQNMLHHFGGFSGTHAHLSFMPDKKIGLVIINNEDVLSARLSSIIADYIYGKLLNEKDVENTVKQRFEELNQMVSGVEKMLKKEQQRITKRKMNLSLPLHSYFGKYNHPLLGTMTISKLNQSQIKVNWGLMNAVATGFDKKDIIRVTLKPRDGETIVFDVKEKVVSLTYQGIKFNRL